MYVTKLEKGETWGPEEPCHVLKGGWYRAEGAISCGWVWVGGAGVGGRALAESPSGLGSGRGSYHPAAH